MALTDKITVIDARPKHIPENANDWIMAQDVAYAMGFIDGNGLLSFAYDQSAILDGNTPANNPGKLAVGSTIQTTFAFLNERGVPDPFLESHVSFNVLISMYGPGGDLAKAGNLYVNNVKVLSGDLIAISPDTGLSAVVKTITTSESLASINVKATAPGFIIVQFAPTNPMTGHPIYGAGVGTLTQGFAANLAYASIVGKDTYYAFA